MEGSYLDRASGLHRQSRPQGKLCVGTATDRDQGIIESIGDIRIDDRNVTGRMSQHFCGGNP